MTANVIVNEDPENIIKRIRRMRLECIVNPEFFNEKKSGIEKTTKETFFLKFFPNVINATVKIYILCI